MSSPTVVERPPLRDPTDPATWGTARHEAAHALVAVLFHVPFRTVTLHPPPCLNANGAILGFRSNGRNLALAAVYLAGAAGGWDGNPDTLLPYMRASCGRDLRNAERVTEGIASDALAQLAASTARIVRASHAEAVEALAAALVHHPEQELTHRQVADLVEDNSPGGLTWVLRRSTEQLTNGERS